MIYICIYYIIYKIIYIYIYIYYIYNIYYIYYICSGGLWEYLNVCAPSNFNARLNCHFICFL